MKKLIMILTTFIATNAFTQSHSKGTLSLQAGFDLGIHGTIYESQYSGTTVSEDTSGAGTKMFRMDVNYNIFKFLSVGLNFRGGSYIEDPDNYEANGNKVNIFGLSLRLYPVNKDKFAMYIGPTFGTSNLEINRIYTFITTFNYQYKFKSPHFGVDMGFNWYFAPKVGMNFNLGYSGQKFKMEEYSINGSAQDLTNWNNVLTTKGVHLGIGVAFHFLGGN